MMWSVIARKTVFWAVISAISSVVQVEFDAFTLESIYTAFSIDQNLEKKSLQNFRVGKKL